MAADHTETVHSCDVLLGITYTADSDDDCDRAVWGFASDEVRGLAEELARRLEAMGLGITDIRVTRP
jgi:hypothetical protein